MEKLEPKHDRRPEGRKNEPAMSPTLLWVDKNDPSKRLPSVFKGDLRGWPFWGQKERNFTKW